MRIYQCDSCYKIIPNPYIVRIHLCDECYKRLTSYWQIIVKRGEGSESK